MGVYSFDNMQCVADYENLLQTSYEYYENLKIYEYYEIHMKFATYQVISKCIHIHIYIHEQCHTHKCNVICTHVVVPHVIRTYGSNIIIFMSSSCHQCHHIHVNTRCTTYHTNIREHIHLTTSQNTSLCVTQIHFVPHIIRAYGSIFI